MIVIPTRDARLRPHSRSREMDRAAQHGFHPGDTRQRACGERKIIIQFRVGPVDRVDILEERFHLDVFGGDLAYRQGGRDSRVEFGHIESKEPRSNQRPIGRGSIKKGLVPSEFVDSQV